MNPYVSIIIPAYNEEESIGALLDHMTQKGIKDKQDIANE